MISSESVVEIGNVKVTTVSRRGFTVEELAEQALDKIIYVGGNSHPLIVEQAEAFKKQIRGVLIEYMRQAIRSDRTTVYNAIKDAGHPQLAELIRRL